MSHPAIDPFVDEHGQPQVVCGISVLSNAPRVAELAGMLGIDTVWIEVEHGAVSWTEVEMLCMGARSGAFCAQRREKRSDLAVAVSPETQSPE